MTRTKSLSAEVLALPVAGRGLRGPHLAHNLAVGDTLLVFLRHLG